MEKDPIFAEAERLYMLENPGGCLAAEDETVKMYWLGRASSSASFNGDSRFPSEAYDYADDVTPEAVQQIREKASKVIDAEEWEVAPYSLTTTVIPER